MIILPKYKCNKVVGAAKITKVNVYDSDSNTELTLDVNEEDIVIKVDGDYMNKHQPRAGGFFVVYKDGYQSFSPAEAFEEGYTPMAGPEDDGVIYTTDKIPDLAGMHGTAWLLDKSFDSRPDVQATIESWIVSAVYAHPFWSHYMVTCIHLRDIDGTKPANKVFDEATHEVLVVALDPEKPYPLNAAPNIMKPINYAGQWIALNDEEARATVEDCVKGIINGTLSPDTDFRSQWDALFKSK